MSLEASEEEVTVATPLINEWFKMHRPALTGYLPHAITDVRKERRRLFANVLIQAKKVTHYYRLELDLEKLEVSEAKKILPREGG